MLKAILGHSTLAMTMDLYSHVLPTTKQEEMELIAKGILRAGKLALLPIENHCG